MSFSVLLSLYDQEKVEYFQRAICSIWNDQLLKPGEIVIVLDGELTHELYLLLDNLKLELQDKLQVIELKKNVGLAKALNIGLLKCNYDLVARMDTDDVSLPERFNIQYKFMNNNKNIVACGSYIEEFDDSDTTFSNIVKYPLNNEDLIKFSKLRSPICHPSSMLRRNKIIEVGGYPELRLGQDYALWSVLLARGYFLSNIPKVLMKLRTNSDFFNRRGWNSFRYEVKIIKLQYREDLITLSEFIKSFSFRFILRFSPVFLKKIAYKLLRK